MSNKSRRKFLRNSAIAGAGFFIVPRHVIGRGFIAPSDKLRIAGIGVGGKGKSDLAEFAKSQGTNYKLMRALNPWIKGRSLSVKNGRSYIIRLPVKP